MRKLVYLTSFIALFWVIGLVWFGQTLPSKQDWDKKTDALVVLTGGKYRIEEGVSLLKKDLGKRLFISGVNPAIKDKLEITHLGNNNSFLDRIDLGYESTNTIENAVEVAHWVHSNDYKSMRLVTSNYHLRRSLIEFNKYLPEVLIVPHPVQIKGSWWNDKNVHLIFIEYNKFLEALLRFAFYRINKIFTEL